MRKFFLLCCFEFKVQNNVHSLIIGKIILFLFVYSTMVFVIPFELWADFMPGFFLIFTPIASVMLSWNIFSADTKDGLLEVHLTIFEPIVIILGKYLSMCFCNFLSLIINIIFLGILFNFAFSSSMLLFVASLVLNIIVDILIIFLGVTKCYLAGKGGGYLWSIMFPLMVPSVILAGSFINEVLFYYFWMLLGIAMIIVPLGLLCSCYLVKFLFSR